MTAKSIGTADAANVSGLSDRTTWLQEDYPRDDGAARRPLPYDEDLHPKLASEALRHALADAPKRRALWHLPKHR